VEVLGTFEGTDRLEEREIFARYCDTSKIKKELGFQATISVEEGVRRIADYGVVHEDWPTLYKPK
jgi:nucleoside-diphosphate-sugar epimerase